MIMLQSRLILKFYTLMKVNNKKYHCFTNVIYIKCDFIESNVSFTNF